MSVFSRLLGIGSAKANQVIDALEDPIPMMEEAIRQDEKNLGAGIEALAGTRAEAKRARREYEESKGKIGEYAQSAERLEKEPGKQMLARRAFEEAVRLKNSLPTLQKIAEDREKEEAELQRQVDDQQRRIADKKRKLATLRQLDRAATASEKFNKRRAGVDPSEGDALFERMERKVQEKVASAEAYGEIADQRAGALGLEEELRQALPPPSEVSSGNMADEIALLKAQLNS